MGHFVLICLRAELGSFQTLHWGEGLHREGGILEKRGDGGVLLALIKYQAVNWAT